MKLTEKQKKFCDYYLETYNATESAKRAGYSEKTAYSIGNENLKKVEIRKYIDKAIEKQDKERIASKDEVLEFFTKVMRGEIDDISVVFGEEHKVSPSIKERSRAAENLGKRYGLFTDRVSIDTNNKVIINENTKEMEEAIKNGECE